MIHFLASRDYPTFRIQQFIADLGVFRCIGHFGSYVHCSVNMGGHSQVAEMGLGDSHQRHIAEDSHRSPIIEAVELVTLETRIDTHRQLLRLTFEGLFRKIRRQVEQTGVISRLPRTDQLLVNPKVVASQHTVQPDENLLTFPCFRHRECCVIVARQRVRIVVFRLAEAIRLPATRHRDLTPCAIVHLQLPHAVQRFHHRFIGHRPHTFEGIHHDIRNPISDDTRLPHLCKYPTTKLFCSASIEMYLITLQCEIAGIDDIKILILTLQLIQCRHLGRALSASFGEGTTNHRHRSLYSQDAQAKHHKA